ncbi:hypothetical protein JF546_16865 [Nitratireductor aquimarinus]|uniref:hypothetical protein n=1 Tax=Nitratireductor aquimarinus TaxID=889300 RepID=UPI001A8D36FF|nr:hypothetical protein [Nitratireductor aquimarinus]MBN8244690.1 hypothetical protein [Nitratireductor aquimarinus]MBY6133077.1 hypothetical protein [Nitratireductor aquimarinus]MCA1305010.1 hypothetical protein [Nitratireductor aquimarinus]
MTWFGLISKALLSPLGKALAAVLAVSAIAGGVYLYGHQRGAALVLQRLQSDRITILKDGRKIDEEALGADDTGLCALLGGCELPDGGDH